VAITSRDRLRVSLGIPTSNSPGAIVRQAVPATAGIATWGIATAGIATWGIATWGRYRLTSHTP